MRLAAAAFLAAALFCSATPALAQDETFPAREFGEWSVYGAGGDCFMEKDIGGGTTVFLGTSAYGPLTFGAFNPAWKGFESAGEVSGRQIAIDGVSKATGGLGLEHGFTLWSDNELGTISSARAVTLKGGDKTVSFSLANTGDAIAYLRACDAKIERD